MSLNQRFINSIKSLYFHHTTFLDYNRKNTLPTAPHNLMGLEDSSFVALETTANKQRRRIDLHLQRNTGNTLSNKDNQLAIDHRNILELPFMHWGLILLQRGSIRILKDLSIWFRRLEPHPYWLHICLEPWNKFTYLCPPVDQSLYINR